MIKRLAISFAVLITALTGVAFQGPRIDRPTLLAFKADQGKHCEACEQYVAAYYHPRDARFRNTICRLWCLQSFHADQRPDLVRRYNVTDVPTFILIDRHGNEIRRVVGWPGAEQLCHQLQGVSKIAPM